MTFRTTIVLGGKTATGLRVPPEVVTELGAGKRPAVRVSIGPYTYRSTVAVMRGDFMIPLSAEHRAAAGLAAGDEVDVDLKLDEEPRVVAVPPDFAEAMNTETHRRFDALSYSRQRQHVLAIEGARTPGTRQRRITKALDELGGGAGNQAGCD